MLNNTSVMKSAKGRKVTGQRICFFNNKNNQVMGKNLDREENYRLVES